jgi:magnesium-transporting ATPase (P-type)
VRQSPKKSASTSSIPSLTASYGSMEEGRPPGAGAGFASPIGVSKPKFYNKNDEFDWDDDEIDLSIQRTGNILFGGTKVKAVHGAMVSSSSSFGKEKCIAVCYRTGFRSAKGQLVASLLYPKEGFMVFIADALWVILFMVLLTTAMYVYVAFELKAMGASMFDVILRYFDAITIAVPPALTACLTVATVTAIGRLKQRDIFVSETNRVNWAGLVSAACFDKTGASLVFVFPPPYAYILMVIYCSLFVIDRHVDGGGDGIPRRGYS